MSLSSLGVKSRMDPELSLLSEFFDDADGEEEEEDDDELDELDAEEFEDGGSLWQGSWHFSSMALFSLRIHSCIFLEEMLGCFLTTSLEIFCTRFKSSLSVRYTVSINTFSSINLVKVSRSLIFAMNFPYFSFPFRNLGSLLLSMLSVSSP